MRALQQLRVALVHACERLLEQLVRQRRPQAVATIRVGWAGCGLHVFVHQWRGQQRRQAGAHERHVCAVRDERERCVEGCQVGAVQVKRPCGRRQRQVVVLVQLLRARQQAAVGELCIQLAEEDERVQVALRRGAQRGAVLQRGAQAAGDLAHAGLCVGALALQRPQLVQARVAAGRVQLLRHVQQAGVEILLHAGHKLGLPCARLQRLQRHLRFALQLAQQRARVLREACQHALRHVFQAFVHQRGDASHVRCCRLRRMRAHLLLQRRHLGHGQQARQLGLGD
jgi:hypothetical protein